MTDKMTTYSPAAVKGLINLIISSKNKLPVKVRSPAYITVWKLAYNYRQLIFKAYISGL